MSLVSDIERLTARRLKRVPNWSNPKGYNDKIQWLKVHDQTEGHVAACDKLQAREIAARRVGKQVLLPLYYSGKPRYIDKPHVLKANHDSGSWMVVRCRASYARAEKRISKLLKQTYGRHKGEWAYALIRPQAMAESLMPDPVVDYKFHCAHGRIRWVQVITERSTGYPLETVLDSSGRVMGLHMDHKMRHGLESAYPGQKAWAQLCSVAERLSESWRYVRVDLYYVDGVRFGELTFWPLSGTYMTKDEPVFGELLDIDLSYRYPPIVT